MPTPYTVTRSITIAAPTERIHNLISDFRQWPQWSPWEDVDPQLRRTYSGADAGVGAAYAWEGNRRAGRGTMAITADRSDQVDIDLHFDKPFRADNRIEFVLEPKTPESTAVQWRMHGTLSGLMWLFAKVKSMDSFLGPDFEKGLAQLKRAAEAGTTS